jgi:hypothetical protein
MPSRYSDEYAHSDYPYRVYINAQEAMDAVMAKLSALIDYENFKDMIKATPHQKAKLEPLRGILEPALQRPFFSPPLTGVTA